MFKKIFLIILFFSFLIFSFFPFLLKVSAFDNFVKYEKNPLTLNIPENYLKTNIRQAHIYKTQNQYEGVLTIFKPLNNQFVLIVINSSDGLNWSFKKEIEIDQESSEFSNPRVFIENNGNKNLFFTVENNGVYKIYLLKCDQNFNCLNPPKLIINPDNDKDRGVFASYVNRIDNQYYMFYGSWGDNGFSIRLAFSNDLYNWTKCSKKILLQSFDGPFTLKENENFYLFYHRSDSLGIGFSTTTSPLTCDSTFENNKLILFPDKSYDQNHLIFPSIIKEKNGIRIYYTSASNNWSWSLNLACNYEGCINTVFNPIIILPGMMASWNGKAIIHNQDVSIFDWKIPSFVKEYTGIISSLQNLGYQENQNFYVFPYDWRKPIESSANDLNSFLQQKIWQQNPNQKVNLIGHSLGGLVARIFAQKNKDKVNQIISVGSSHQGAVQVYKTLEAGEIDRENTFLWLAQKLVLLLNKTSLEPDRETIKKRFPVAKDLFPTFNFLKDKNGQEIPIDNLSIKNNTLLNYNPTFSQIFDIFTAIYGEKGTQTPAGYVIDEPNLLDKLLGNYADGKPIDIWYEKGDHTVLSKSANQDNDSQMLVFDHGEIITEKESIKKIFDVLNISYSEDKIVAGQKTKISPSLIFLIKSPAKMKVNFNDQIFEEEDGIIFIPDASGGDYQLQIQGVNLGKYTVFIGQIAQNNDIWEKIEGEINQDRPTSQIDSYLVNFNTQTANPIFPTPTPTIILSPTTTLTPTSTPRPILTPQSSPTPTQSLQTPTSTPSSQPSTQNSISNQTSTAINNTSDNQSKSFNNNSSRLSWSSPTPVLFSSTKKSSEKEAVLGGKTQINNQNKNQPSSKKNNYSLMEAVVAALIPLFSFGALIIKNKILKNKNNLL